jgi:hypothetical protein
MPRKTWSRVILLQLLYVSLFFFFLPEQFHITLPSTVALHGFKTGIATIALQVQVLRTNWIAISYY